jgi:Spy/CpxP family protein refolding chaperone
MRQVLGLAIVLALGASSALAQSHAYPSLKDRQIKGLSTEDIASLRAGRGMGMALPAELNRYPGPLHVLEHEAALGLTADQRQQVQGQFESMRREAVALGEQVIAGEATLDALFTSGTADAASIDAATARLALLYGQLRAVHLRTHLATRATLTDAQLAAYSKLRGYDSAAAPVHKH